MTKADRKQQKPIFDDDELVPAKIPRGCLKMLKTLSSVYGGTLYEWTAKLLRPALVAEMRRMTEDLEKRYLGDDKTSNQR